jgi:hypothetical protein
MNDMFVVKNRNKNASEFRRNALFVEKETETKILAPSERPDYFNIESASRMFSILPKSMHSSSL